MMKNQRHGSKAPPTFTKLPVRSVSAEKIIQPQVLQVPYEFSKLGSFKIELEA